MGTTDSNDIYFYEETDAVSPLHTLLNTGQQSVSDALSASARIFPVANDAAKTALALVHVPSTTEPLLVRQIDNNTYFENVGSGWKAIAGAPVVSGSGGLSATTTETVLAGCTISLVAGTWNLDATGYADWSTAGGTPPRWFFRIRQTNTSGTILDEKQIYIGGHVGSVPVSLARSNLVIAAPGNVLLTAYVTGPASGSTGVVNGTIRATRVA